VECAKCAWNGHRHADAVVSLADTFEGDVTCVAQPVHKGRSTQVWDAELRSEASGRQLAQVRCTQMTLYPR